MRELLAARGAPVCGHLHERSESGFAPEVLCVLSARLAASAFGVAVKEILSGRRSPRRVSTARQIGMYLAHTAAGLPLTTVAEYFGRDRTTAAHACRLIEDRRDDRKFDTELDEIEELFRAILRVAR